MASPAPVSAPPPSSPPPSNTTNSPPPPTSSASPPPSVPPPSTPPPTTSPPSPLSSTPPPTTSTPSPPSSAPPPTTSPPSPPSSTPPPTTTPPSPPSSTPPPTTSPPSPPSSTPPPTTAPPSPPSSTQPPTTVPPPPFTPPPTTTPPSPPSSTPPPTESFPSPPTGGGGGNGTPPPPTGRTGSPPTSQGSPPSPSSNNGGPSSGGGVSTGLVVGIAIGGVAVLLLLSILYICCQKKKRRPPPPPPPPPKPDPYNGSMVHNWQHNVPPPKDHHQHLISIPPPPRYLSSGGGSNYSVGSSDTPLPPPSSGLGLSKNAFTYEELAMATDGFSDANLLGQGGFGYVHRGVLLNGKEVAVKQLKVGSGQGEREFQAEVEIISRVHHRHLVSLVGYCSSGDRRLLVYEFVTNNTLEFHLHGKGRPVMEWPVRLRIAMGSAKGLAYLHEDCHPKIIHRDIKAANILLDFNFEAKVADFGLAKFTSDANTHVSTRVMGTFGYLAPEYASSGKLTEKSDVFSFGVMLLELITGRRPVDTSQAYTDDSLVDWARPLLTQALEDGNFDSLIDGNLQNEYNHSEMARMVACAAACVRHSAKRRPRMSQVVRALEGDVSLSDLNEGIKPGHSTMYSSYESSDYDTTQYNEDMKKFRKMALASQEYESSGLYSNPTSEYGLYPSGSSSDGRQNGEMEMGKLKEERRGF